MENKAQVKYTHSNNRDFSGHFKHSSKKKSKTKPTILLKQLMRFLD